jgi:hypothetical protein
MGYMIGTILKRSEEQDFYIVKCLNPCHWSGLCVFESLKCETKLVAVEKMLSLNGSVMYCPLDLDKEFEVYMGENKTANRPVRSERKEDKPKRLLRFETV